MRARPFLHHTVTQMLSSAVDITAFGSYNGAHPKTIIGRYYHDRYKRLHNCLYAANLRAYAVANGAGKHGEIKNSFQNCIMALSYDPDLRGRFRRNLLTERIDLSPSLPWSCRSKIVNDTEMNYLLWYLEQVYILTNEKKILKALDIVSSENRYHPIQEYLNSLK